MYWAEMIILPSVVPSFLRKSVAIFFFYFEHLFVKATRGTVDRPFITTTLENVNIIC